MIRWLFLIVSTGLVFSPVLDAAVKGTVVLLLACAVCLLLRRNSAATRHLVWATAIALLLALPLLSGVLPQWRVLPNWPWANQDVTLSSRSAPEPVAEARPATATPRSWHSPEDDAGHP